MTTPGGTRPMDSQLLPCRFCPDGGEPDQLPKSVMCRKCGADAPTEVWNRAALEARAPEGWRPINEGDKSATQLLVEWGDEMRLAYYSHGTGFWRDTATGTHLQPHPTRCFDVPAPDDSPPARDVVPTGTPQGVCETTLTERFAYPECRCGTYPENLGPCKTFVVGANPQRCVYCDHTIECHIALAARPAPDAAPAQEGMVLVPIEPTDAMIDAGLSADPEFITEVWSAMVVAATPKERT